MSISVSDTQLNQLQETYGVSRDVLDRLTLFADELSKWSKRINLIGPGTAQDIWSRHILDSLQLIGLIERPKSWVDFGSGGGLPGMVVACVYNDHADSQVTLVESNRKKTAFLRSVMPKIANRALIRDERIEDYVTQDNAPGVVSARAVAALEVMFDWLAPWSGTETVYLFPKGRGYEKELRDSQSAWRYDCAVHPSRIDPDSVVLEIRNLKRV